MQQITWTPASDAIAETQLDLPDPLSRPRRVDRHPQLEPPAVGERDELAQRGDPHRALAREGRLEQQPGLPLERPPCVTQCESQAPALRVFELRDGQVGVAALNGVDERDEPAR